MSAQATATDGKSWALSNPDAYTAIYTRSAVPVAISLAGAGTRPGRHAILTRCADIATVVHTSWIRRDLLWIWPVLLLVAVLSPR